MSEESKESRVNIDDLPQAEQELTPEEAKDVQGGEGRTRLIVGQDQGIYGSGVSGPDFQFQSDASGGSAAVGPNVKDLEGNS